MKRKTSFLFAFRSLIRTFALIMRKVLLYGVLLLLLCVVHAKADDIGRKFTMFNASDGLSDNSAQSIICAKTGRLVIATIGHINFYDGKGFTAVDPANETDYELKNYTGHYHPYFDAYHHMWLKNKHSVTCLYMKTENFISNIDSVFASLGVKDKVTDMFVAANGEVWMMHGNKIFGSEVKKDFPVENGLSLQDLAVYNDKLLLLFYDNGEVVGFDIATQKQLYRLRAYDESATEKYGLTSLIFPHKNQILQIRDGYKEGILLSFDVERRQWTTLMKCPYRLNNVTVHNEVVYLASEYCYWMYDLKTKKATHVEELTLENGKKLLTDINTITFDLQGGMWMGTERRGLLYAKPYAPPFLAYEWSEKEALDYFNLLEKQPVRSNDFNGEWVNCIYEDSRHWTWVGTRKGLRLYKTKDAKPVVFTRKDGLFNGVIHSVVEDAKGDMWVSTSYGISYLPIKGGEVGIITSYNEIDNVPNETFSNGRAMRLPDGTIVMQSLDHIVVFNPAHFHHDAFKDYKFVPKLVGLMVNGTQIFAGTEIEGKQILDLAITRAKEINVDYNHNTLSFVFSGLNFFRPLQTYYRYRVPELDESWHVVSYFNSAGMVDSNGALHLPLTGLQPGEYHIELQASMFPDVWIQEPLTWVIHVNEPWWRTDGVYLSLGLIVFVLFVLNLLLFSRNEHLRIRRAVGEQEMLRQMKNLISRNDMLGEGLFSVDTNLQTTVTPSAQQEQFFHVMTKLAPSLRTQTIGVLNLRDLSRVVDMDVEPMARLVSENISKDTYELALRLHLDKARELLRYSGKPIEEIASECSFATPNFFIASFLRVYKQTPLEYRLAEL